MGYGITPVEKRLKEEIKHYRITSLFRMNELQEYLKCIAAAARVSILLTERHGEKVIAIGDFACFQPDVVNEPGRKIRVADRTVGHIYTVNHNDRPDRAEEAEELLNALTAELSDHASEAYRRMVLEQYTDELEVRWQQSRKLGDFKNKEDALTGMLNEVYFQNRLNVVDRSEVVPVAAICININDWRYVNEKFGEEESDRLIRMVAHIIRRESKPEYILGRVDGDVFHVLIPMVEEGEAEDFCRRTEQHCGIVEDERLAPSVACGIVKKDNVEQRLSDLFSDAEYRMLQRKLEMKNSPGYRERLEKRAK